MAKKLPRYNYKRWTASADRAVLADKGPIEDLAKRLGRSEAAVMQRRSLLKAGTLAVRRCSFVKNGRHWFSVYGYIGLRSPVCRRCGLPNPRPLTVKEQRAYDRWHAACGGVDKPTRQSKPKSEAPPHVHG